MHGGFGRIRLRRAWLTRDRRGDKTVARGRGQWQPGSLSEPFGINGTSPRLRQRSLFSRHASKLRDCHNARSQSISGCSKGRRSDRLLRGGSRRSELMAAPRVSHALAVAHLGQWDLASTELLETIAEVDGTLRSEALVEAADAWTWYGDSGGAVRLQSQAEHDGNPSAFAIAHLALTRARLLARLGHGWTKQRSPWPPCERSLSIAVEAMNRESAHFAAARIAVRAGDRGPQPQSIALVGLLRPATCRLLHRLSRRHACSASP